ncbi:MAG: redoxin [Methylomonas sp.]|nr:MAG: redoxin [Methylomonas sp.]PPD39303.1 MAG: redoxin [Methylomonas sp.]PPD52522.1 MAG: redoxin [Methylomonas sp.]
MTRSFIAAVLVCSFAASPVSATNVGDAAPACESARSLTQQALAPAHFSGKVVLIDFWATWCPPCKQSMPFLNSTRNALQAQGFEVIAVNVDEDSGEAQAFLNRNPVDYPQFFDATGGCPQIYAVKAMPSSYLVDKSGKIRMIHKGFRDEDKADIEKAIHDLLTE